MFEQFEFPKGSVVIDPFRMINKDQKDLKVIRIGDQMNIDYSKFENIKSFNKNTKTKINLFNGLIKKKDQNYS